MHLLSKLLKLEVYRVRKSAFDIVFTLTGFFTRPLCFRLNYFAQALNPVSNELLSPAPILGDSTNNYHIIIHIVTTVLNNWMIIDQVV